MGANLADSLVEPFHHRMVFGGLGGRRLIAILGEQPFGRRVRVVRHHGRIPGEERLPILLRAADEIRERRQGLAADVEPLITMAAALRHAFGETARLVRTHPPLTRLQAHVTLLTEEAGQDRRRLEELDHLGTPFEEGGALLFGGGGLGGSLGAGSGGDGDERVVAGQSVTMHVATGQHGGQARPAEGVRDVAAREGARFRGEFIEMGRADRLRTHEPVIEPGVVVRDDHQDIGTIGGGEDSAAAGQPCKG